MKRHDRPACRMEVLAGETNFFKCSDFFVDRTFSARIWQQCPVLSNSPHAQLGFFPVGPRYPCHRRHLSAPPGWPGHKFVLMGISIFLSVCLWCCWIRTGIFWSVSSLKIVDADSELGRTATHLNNGSGFGSRPKDTDLTPSVIYKNLHYKPLIFTYIFW